MFLCGRDWCGLLAWLHLKLYLDLGYLAHNGSLVVIRYYQHFSCEMIERPVHTIRTQEVRTLLSNTVPRPLKHLHNYAWN